MPNALHVAYSADAATSTEGKKPTPGSISICIKCGNIAKFDDRLHIVPLSAEEMDELKNNNEVWANIQFHISLIKKIKK